MKKFLSALLTVTAIVSFANTVVYQQDKVMTIVGKVNDRYVCKRSKEFPAEPNTWYRASAEIRCAMEPSDGRLRFRVRNVAANGKSIVYANPAILKPVKLDFTKHSDIFMTKPNCARLQVYFILDRINGHADIRNVKIEKISAEEVEKVLASKRVEPAFFSPPDCIYSGERSFFWGYRVSAAFVDPKLIPAAITCAIPELKVNSSAKVKVNDHVKVWARIKRPVKPGKYQVIMKALDKTGKVLLENRSILTVIDRPAYGSRFPVKSVSIDADGNVLVNGRKTLLNGIYHAHTVAGAKNIAYAGFNAAQSWAPNPASYKKVLDLMAANRIYANCVLKYISGKKLDDLMTVIKEHPAILSWDIVDEPAIRNITPEKIMPCVNQVRNCKTGKPLRISFSDVTAVAKYQKCYDMPATHKYVLPFDGIAAQGEVVRQIVKSIAPGQSPQITLQSWVHWYDESQRPQSVAQTRSIAYISLINGAKGLWWYHYPTAYKIPHLWGALIRLNAELFELEDIILGKRTVLSGAPSTVEAAMFTNGKRTVIIAVNTAKTPVAAAISPVNGTTLTELFANGEKIAVKDGSAQIQIPAESTRIFEL